MLYGPSGVGKSSLLRAAVARSLRALPEEPLVVVFSSWSDDPTLALSEAVGEASGLSTNGSVVTALERAQATRDVYLVLDQAEEYFLYHADDGGPGSFAEALPEMLAAPLACQRSRLPARGLARQARPLHGKDPEPLREHPPPRPTRSRRGESSRAATCRALCGAHG